MKTTKQIVLAILLIIPCITWGQITYRYTMDHDENGNRKNRLQTKRIFVPIEKTDSAVIVAADSALYQSITEENNQINAAEQSIINVYPNPATDKVVVSYSSACASCQLRIYNSEAKQVYESIGVDKETEIDLSQLGKGVYYLSITTAEGKKQGWKIIKQ